MNYQLVVRFAFRQAVLELLHDSLLGGHLGIWKTMFCVQNQFL